MSESWSSGYVTEVDYTHGFYQELMPSQIRFATLSKGFRSNTDVADGMTYCELGCGQGVTANLLAAANPEIEVYATDFNPGHAYNACRLADEAALKNVHFFDDSFSEFEQRRDLPQFNIISLHGIYSWVTKEHRDTIVRFIDKRLKPGGLVYISYNCLPGWAGPAPLRQLMRMHVENASGILTDNIGGALNFLEELHAEGARYFKSISGIDDRLKDLNNKGKNYIAHEYLNREWSPFYHSDVVSDLSSARLSYLSTMDIIEHVDDVNLTRSQKDILDRMSDPAFRETTRDYIVNRQFRKDVFGRGVLALSTQEAREEWLDTRFVLPVRAQDVSMKVKTILGEVSIHEETCRPLIDALDAAGGHARLRDLVRDPAVARLGWARLQRILRLLVGDRALHPGPSGVLDMDRRKESTTLFNKAVLKQSIYSDKLKVLASPVTGGGVSVGRLPRLLLLAHMEKKENQTEFVWGIMKNQTQKLSKEGKVLETEAENISFLREKNDNFIKEILPVLQRLGIA